MLIEKLENHKAKTDGQSIKEHNDKLLAVLSQLRDIYDIDDDTYKKLERVSYIHDIGKAHYDFQENILSKSRKVRHEVLSASYKDLSEDERIAVLLHHKNIDKLCEGMMRAVKYYKSYRKELEEILDIETIDILNLIAKLNRPTLYNRLKDRHLFLLKGYLQLCDHLASAGITNIKTGLDVNSIYNYPKLSSIQSKVKNMKKGKDIIIQAMTGLGKTSTAMYWSDLVQNKDKNKRIYYILPYTASINAKYEEFSDLGISTAMLHSKAQYFLDKELEDAEGNKARYQMFKKSVQQLTVCTIYQLFKAIFSCKNFEMLLCQMKNSIFIIDEIHCFDTKQLALILTTLRYLKQNYGINICVMSASVPSCLLNLLKEELDISTVVEADTEDLIKRHRLSYNDSFIVDNLDKIKKDLEDGKQVLVCVNNVALSQQMYEIFKNHEGLRLIHGKFNTRDREKAEKNLGNQNLLIGTQAIEVSLNISYDILYTEIAPLDALLQRFGRVNRKGEMGIAEIHIFKNSNERIYDEKVIANTVAVIKEIIQNDSGIVEESKVNYYLDKVYEDVDRDGFEQRKININKLIDNLTAGLYTNDSMENTGVQVLPASLIQEYDLCIDNKDYISANSLLVNISDRLFKQQYNKQIVYRRGDVLVTNCKYSEKKGLEYELDEDAMFI